MKSSSVFASRCRKAWKTRRTFGFLTPSLQHSFVWIDYCTQLCHYRTQLCHYRSSRSTSILDFLERSYSVAGPYSLMSTDEVGTMASTNVRNILVTGAGRGIGRGLSRLLLQKGHRVFLLDSNEEELKHTASVLAKSHRSGQDFDTVVCNLRSHQEIKSAAKRAGEMFAGHLDCLINNAAGRRRHSVL